MAAVCAVVMIASGLFVVTTPVRASANSYEAQFVSDTNATRESHGLAPLAVSGDLTWIARNWSAHMSSTQTISHNPNLTTQVQNWQAVGENVGAGPNEPAIESAFMSTPEHRGNILNPAYTQIGVGVVRDSRGQLWVTVDFRRPMNAGAVTSTWHPARSGAVVPMSRQVVSVSVALQSRLRAAQVVVRRMHPLDPVAETITYVTVMSTLIR